MNYVIEGGLNFMEELNKQINDFINSDKVEDIKSNSVSKDEAKSRVKQFFS